MSISRETYAAVEKRSGKRCENPKCKSPAGIKLEKHHCYWKSQYKGIDRDEEWNQADICWECHQGTTGVHNGNKELDLYLKAMADERKPVELRVGGIHPDLCHARHARKSAYRRQVARFKEKNGGKSPWKVKYERDKKLLKS